MSGPGAISSANTDTIKQALHSHLSSPLRLVCWSGWYRYLVVYRYPYAILSLIFRWVRTRSAYVEQHPYQEVWMSDRHHDGLTHECKSRCGLDVDEVAVIAGIPRRSLYNWWKTKRRVIELILSGIAYEAISPPKEWTIIVHFRLHLVPIWHKMYIKDWWPMRARYQ